MVCTQRGVCLAAGLMRLLRPIKIIRIIFGASSQELGWAGACMGSFTQAAADQAPGDHLNFPLRNYRGAAAASPAQPSPAQPSSAQPSPAQHATPWNRNTARGRCRSQGSSIWTWIHGCTSTIVFTIFGETSYQLIIGPILQTACQHQLAHSQNILPISILLKSQLQDSSGDRGNTLEYADTGHGTSSARCIGKTMQRVEGPAA